jgi:hypothetical protein
MQIATRREKRHARLSGDASAWLANGNHTGDRSVALEGLLPWGKCGNYLRQEFRQGVMQQAGLAGSLKKIRKSSASHVELHHPGMGAVHLGHRLSASISHNHYLDPRIVAKNRPMPTELRGDL